MFKFFKKIYKPLFCFCLCFFSVFVLIGCSGGQTNDTSSGKKSGKRSSALHQEMAIGSEAPDFTAKLNNGETFTLSDKTGQVTGGLQREDDFSELLGNLVQQLRQGNARHREAL